VLLTCEAGCRPAAVADALHARTRGATPFISADFAATEPLETEHRLFGGPARSPRPLECVTDGAALLAAGDGTLFLENVEELPAGSQRRLARVLRDGEVCSADGRRVIPARFRLVVSSTRDLEAEVRDGRFRGDLLRRLAACSVPIPPLRQRAADFPALIARLLDEMDAARRSFTQPALTVLTALPWTANLDELALILARIIGAAGAAGAAGGDVRQEDVLMHLPIGGAFRRMDLTASLREARRRFEREYIAAVLERHHWRMSDAARTLGIERANLYRKARQLGITRARSAGTKNAK
jgi:DNA-binding NtrC family response regulator